MKDQDIFALTQFLELEVEEEREEEEWCLSLKGNYVKSLGEYSQGYYELFGRIVRMFFDWLKNIILFAKCVAG